ncbi:T9SS type A sorting domain-containing protein [Hymenobacter cellulosivorans]|uniref:T9SS type A sorting domain-containing protein n=1 Tax=Hymenobacter cellulosivorans TaxID=2932249 RepID=A0ABY4F9J7_9BACT|nr:T9SS type A sorting domain-containing protein [Hymenobacter cellulosivorans]UOQ52619.1 T9SS type A sorting domain-containing protein [Hymenobacter cellulosivorans]
MRHIYLSVGFAFTLGLSAAQAQTPAWTSGLQPTNPTATDDTGAAGVGLAVDASGNQYVAGILQNGAGSGASATRVFGSTTLTGGSGFASGFVAKLSPTQQWLWALKATGNGEALAFEHVVVNPAGDTYAIGDVSDDQTISPNGGTLVTVGSLTYTTTKAQASFITRLNANGQPQALIGTSGTRILAAGWDATAGNLVVAGEYSGTVTLGGITLPAAPIAGVFVARLNAAGQWVSAVGATSTGTASSSRFVVSEAAVGPQGQVALAFRIRNGSVTLGGTTVTSTSTTQAINIVAQLSAANQWAWATQVAAAGTSSVAYIANELQYDRTGNVWLAGEGLSTGLQIGSTTVNEDEFVARLSPTGQWGAVGTIGHAGSANGATNTEALAVDAQGNAVMVGNMPNAITYTFGTRTLVNPTAGRNFVARFNPTTQSWDYAQLTPSVSTNGEFTFGAIALDVAGNMFATGDFLGSITFGANTLTYPASFGSNAFVAKLSNAGLPLGVRQVAGVAPLALYPNPAAAGTFATLRLSSSTSTALPVTLRDALGRAVRTSTVLAGQQEARLATAGLAPGLYLLEAGAQRAQLVVQ